MLEDMDGKIDAIVDGGPCSVGVESTIMDLTCTPPRLLRPGGVTLEQLREALGEVAVDPAVTRLMGAGEKPRAPGMKYRHYAPKAPVTVVKGDPAKAPPPTSAAHLGPGGRGDLLRRIRRAVCRPSRWSIWARRRTRPPRPGMSSTPCVAFDGTAVPAIWAQCPDEAGTGPGRGQPPQQGGGVPYHRPGGRAMSQKRAPGAPGPWAERNIPYQLWEHPAVYTIEEMDALHLPAPEAVVKNLFLRDAKGKAAFFGGPVQGEAGRPARPGGAAGGAS